MTATTQSLSERVAQNQAGVKANTAAKDSAKATAETQQAARDATVSATRVFYGEFPPAVSYLTPAGTPVYFHQGYHITDNSEVAEFCETLKDVTDVTSQVNLEDVPRPEHRTRQRNWAGNTERTTITPGELLSRAVRVQSTAQLPQAATSNSGVTD